jgi:hypothetical protein
MSTALTIALCLRDNEAQLPDMVRTALGVARTLAREHAADEWRDSTWDPDGDSSDGSTEGDSIEADREEDPAVDEGGDLPFELLALDESSRDNTLSVLSILHSKVLELATLSDLAPGTAIMRAARTARGRVWLIVDGPFELEHALWATRQVFCGDRAALVPGELLAVERNLGQATLGWLHGGLATGQREVERMLAAHGEHGAWSPARTWGVRERARLFLRGRLGQLGLGHLDRR